MNEPERVIRQAFPDGHGEIPNLVERDGTVVVECRMSGANTGRDYFDRQTLTEQLGA